MAKQNRSGCYDCGRRYGDEYGFPDLLVPHWVWKRISPSGDEGGLLCPSCLCQRLHAARIRCEGAFMSGPVQTVSRTTMEMLCSIETMIDTLNARKENPNG